MWPDKSNTRAHVPLAVGRLGADPAPVIPVDPKGHNWK
jgi:hypothetical protein